MIAVVSGNRKEYDMWCKSYYINPFKNPNDAIYIERVDCLYGIVFDSVTYIGSYKNRKDIDNIKRNIILRK